VRDCVVGLRGLELRANHAVAIEPISGRGRLADFLGSNVAELPKNPRKDWQSAAKGAVLSEISGASGRSEILPCRLARRGGASVVRREAVINLTEDLNVKICEEAVTLKICIVRVVC
jgi:hypothetical protein